MAEPNPSEQQLKQAKTIQGTPKLPDNNGVEQPESVKITRPLSRTGSLGSSDPSLQTFLENSSESRTHAPSWVRPFFSLSVQLITAYVITLLLIVPLVCLLTYQQTNLFMLILICVAMIVLGTVVSFALISLLLRPLWRLTDAAQAIAVGDLKQRSRLPLRLPPQDEIDRLAGSMSEMVTRLERAEELQRASEKRFTQFFSDASHQLRTPLTSLRGFTEVLMRGAKDDPETSQRVLKRMKSEAERMTALINDLLTLARLDDTQLLKKEYVNLVDLSYESIAQIKTRANAERTISLDIASEETLGLQGDQDRLKQLLFILLDNALKYGRQAPDGEVTIRLTKQKGQAIIQVIDNGEGITEKDMAHIFDAFYRGRSASTTKSTPTTGVGLGLTIASAIARAHRGTIQASSEQGKGSTFTVAFPCLN